MKARMRLIYQFHLKRQRVIHRYSEKYWLILVIAALFNKKTLGMVSYGLGDGDTISSPISSKKQPHAIFGA